MFTWLKWCWKFKCIVPWSCRLVQHTEDLSYEQLEAIKHQAGTLARWFDEPLEEPWRKNADKLWRAQGSPMVWGMWEKAEGKTAYEPLPLPWWQERMYTAFGFVTGERRKRIVGPTAVKLE